MNTLVTIMVVLATLTMTLAVGLATVMVLWIAVDILIQAGRRTLD